MEALPSLRQLKYLTALAESLSFSKAADTCNVTQSTLSAGIAALENLLGQSLVDRSRRQVSLTPLGKEIATKAHNLVLAATDIVIRAQEANAPLSGTLRLGIIPTIAPYLLPRLLPQLQESLPEIDLQLTEDLSGRLLAGLRNGDLDVLILAFPFDTPGMVQKKLYAEPFYLACPRDYRKTEKPATLREMEGENLLLLEEGHCLREHALAACKLKPKHDRKAFSTSSLPTLIQMVQHGYGITLLPAMAVEQGPLPRNIEIFPFQSPAPKREIGLVWRESNPREPAFLKLAEVITASN